MLAFAAFGQPLTHGGTKALNRYPHTTRAILNRITHAFEIDKTITLIVIVMGIMIVGIGTQGFDRGSRGLRFKRSLIKRRERRLQSLGKRLRRGLLGNRSCLLSDCI